MHVETVVVAVTQRADTAPATRSAAEPGTTTAVSRAAPAPAPRRVPVVAAPAVVDERGNVPPQREPPAEFDRHAAHERAPAGRTHMQSELYASAVLWLLGIAIVLLAWARLRPRSAKDQTDKWL